MPRFHPPLTTSREEFLKDGTDQLFREAIYALALSVEKLLSCRSVFARILHLTPSQFAVLMGVASQQGERGVTIKDLAAHLAMAPTHVTTEIGRLETKGLLSKRSNEADRRSILVTLTSKGEKEVERISPVVRDVNDILFQNIGVKSLINAHVVANKIVRNSADARSHARKAAANMARKAAQKKPKRQTGGSPG
jgi:DNA-binding MarR family transcriptional regulator